MKTTDLIDHVAAEAGLEKNAAPEGNRGRPR